MRTNLITTSQNAKIALSKSRKLLDLTNKILEKEDDEWLERLWKWADENSISAKDIPRDKKNLLKIKSLTLEYLDAAVIPSEIKYLTQIESLYLHDFSELPDSITSLKNLTDLTLLWYFCENNCANIKLLEKWTEDLIENGCSVFEDCDYH